MRQASLRSLLKRPTLERYDSDEDVDTSSMTATDLLASLGLASKSMRSSRANLGGLGSPTMSYNASKSQLKEPEVAGVIDLQDLSMAEIHQKFSEIYDENNLLRISLQAEVNIREKLEKKNREISEKLVETRQGLQETRTALINLQAVTEDLIQRKEEREMQLQKVISISKTYERRIAELETNSVKSEEVAKLHSIISNTKMAVMEKEEAMQQLEQQILQLQQAVRSARSDVQVAVEDKKFVEVKLQHAGEKINQLDSTVEKQKEKITDMQKATISLESTISSLRDKMADMQMAKVNLETVKMSLESSNSKHKERISELTTANQELQNKIIAMTRTKLEQSQKDYDNKSLTGQLSNGNNLGPAVDSGKDRSGLEERMMALEKMLTNLPMLSGNNSNTSTNTNSGKSSMNRTSSQQRLQQHQPSPSSSKNVPSTPNGGQPRSQPSLRKSMGQSMTSSNGTDEILYEDSNQESRGRFASDSSVGQISRSGSQQDFVSLNLPMGVRTKTQSMDDGSSLRGKLDSMDDYRSKTTSMDDAGDPEVRQAVERTARAMIQSVIPQGGSSPSSSILRKSLGASPSHYNSNSSNHNASVTTPGSRVSFSLDNNSVHVIPNMDKDKDNRNKEKEKEKEKEQREREQREREKEKEREREQREREKEREREEREKEKQREKDRKDKEEKDRRAREERDRRDREERERQKEEQKRREKEQQREAEHEQREQREREQREQKQREKEQREREQKEKEQRDREQKDKEKERSSEIRSRKSMMKQASSKNFDASDPAAVQVRNMKTDINNMISQHRELKNQIKEFTEKFKAEHNGAEPGKVDRKNLAGDIFKNYDKLSKSIKKKMKELEVFQAENGGVGASTKIPGVGTPSTKLQSFDKSSKSSRSDADDGSLSSDDSDDS